MRLGARTRVHAHREPWRAGIQWKGGLIMSVLKTQPESVQVDGHSLRCLMCSHESFHRRKTHFDTALFSGLNPIWSESHGTCLICDHCGFIHWFLQPKVG